VQAMKAGVMEIADLFVVNKSDKPGADRVVNEVRAVLEFLKGRSGWMPTVTQTVAETGDGVAELVAELRSHRDHTRNGEAGKLREETRLRSKIEDVLAERLYETATRLWSARQNEILPLVLNRQLDPYSAADMILAAEGLRRDTLKESPF